MFYKCFNVTIPLFGHEAINTNINSFMVSVMSGGKVSKETKIVNNKLF